MALRTFSAWDGQELAYGIGDGRNPTTVAGYKFYATSQSVQAAGDMKEYKDNVGQTVGLIVPEVTQVIQMSGYLFKNGGSGIVKKGDPVTGITGVPGVMTDGVQWRVQDFSVQWQNEDVAQVSISVKRYGF
jgi:hypothetical protein